MKKAFFQLLMLLLLVLAAVCCCCYIFCPFVVSYDHKQSSLTLPCPIPIKRCGESSVEEAVVLVRRALVAPVDQAGAGRVVVVGELLPVRDGGRGELVTLHLLLLKSQG